MGDNNDADEGIDSGQEGADNGGNADEKHEEGTEDKPAEGGDDNDAADDEGSKADDKKDDPKADDKADDDPPTRKPVGKNVTPFIIQRQQRTINKLRSKKESPKGDDGDGGDEGDDVDPKIQAAVDKRLAPHIETLQSQQDERDVDAFIAEGHEEFKPYRDRALKLMKHPSRASIPVEMVMVEAAGGIAALKKMGASAKQTADDDAKRAGGGGGNDPGTGAPETKVWNQSKEDFHKAQNEVRHKRRD